MNDIAKFTYISKEKTVKINLPEEILNNIDTIVITKHFQDEAEIIIERADGNGEYCWTVDNGLKRLLEEQQELLIRLIFRKMTPASCTDKIQVFENRSEYNKLINLNWQIERFLK